MRQADCWKCVQEESKRLIAEGDWMSAMGAWMVTCKQCGNKRCPKATDHDLPCTGSNEPGQEGSRYEKISSDLAPRTVQDMTDSIEDYMEELRKDLKNL